MKEDRQDLTTGSIWGKMLFFSIPLVLTNFLQVLFKDRKSTRLNSSHRT